MKIDPIIRYFDKTDTTPCPYGNVRRIITGGEGLSNVHVVSVTKGSEHIHEAYDETYYFLSGNGTITLDKKTVPVRPGTVAVIPAKTVHSLESDSDVPLEFIIFGTPPMSIEDDRAKPVKP
ncbi:MAG: cupin domain-containing protein [Deltaproteobacteria bacterium]|nr:cupin domain-containing protein [Deltaproteobacteria bacterium]